MQHTLDGVLTWRPNSPCQPLIVLPECRAGKSAGASHFTLRSGRQQGDGSWQLPLVALTLSLPPSGHHLLSHIKTAALSHEFGHALRILLPKTQFQHFSGAAAFRGDDSCAV